MKAFLLLFSFLVAASPVCAVEFPNLAPPLEGKNAVGEEWTPIHSVAHSLPTRDTKVLLHQAVSLEVASPELDSGYGEWRISPSPVLQKNTTYVFAAALRQQSIEGAPPYLRIYSFDAKGAPKVIGYVAGRIGDSNWYTIQIQFQVPPDSARLRFDAGLFDSRGTVHFGDFQLYEKTDNTPPPMLSGIEENTSNPQWRAHWITAATTGENTIFSTKVSLTQIPLDAYTQIAADGEWILKVNNNFVARGSGWDQIQAFNLAPFLNIGSNEISVDVVKAGGHAALLCQGDWHFLQRKTLHIQSDVAWKTDSGISVSDVGAPPSAPWGDAPLARASHYPALPIVKMEAPSVARAGTIWQAKIVLASPLRLNEQKDWELRWTRDGKPASFSAGAAKVLLNKDGTVIHLSSAISPFATPGKYRWELKNSDARIIPIQQREIEISAATSAHKSTFMWPHHPANRITVNGENGAPYLLDTVRPEVQSYRNWMQATSGHLYAIWLPLSSAWKSPDVIDISELESSLLKILEADPQANISVVLRLDMPSWWCNQYPNECYVSDQGKRNAQSFFSLKWRQDVVAAMKLLKRKMDTMPSAKRICSIVLAGGEGGEMLLPGRTYGEYDVSIAAKNAFTVWCKNNNVKPIKYPDTAMQRPYSMDEMAEAARSTIFRFFADWQADNLIFFSHQTKKIFGAQMQVAAYYGYIMELSDYRVQYGPRLLYSGHLGLQKVLDEGAFDCLMSISSYSLRRPNLAGGYDGPIDSISLHGITHVTENDIRTNLVKNADTAGQPAANLEQTRELYRREMLNAAQKGSAIRYHSLLHDIDFLQDPQILQFIGELGQEVQKLKPLTLGNKNEVAFVIDDDSLYNLTSLSTWKTLPPIFLSQSRDVLARMNRPVAWLLWDDWVKNKDKFKTAIFPLPSLLSPEHRQQIEAWTGVTMPPLNDNSGALVADKIGMPSLKVFTDLNTLTKAVGDTDSGEGTPVRYIGDNFHFDYANGKFSPN